jgi:carbonic anhydrase/acetyltransferase-like protein (isoleucine patch superfamily)
MRIEHRGHAPVIDPSAYVAPSAVVSGAVRLGAHVRVLHGAVLTAEGGPVELGAHCIVMEQAVLRGTARHPVRMGHHVLVGPRAYLSGCTVGDYAFLATGATVFNGAVIGRGAEVRINGVVHLRTVLPAEAVVPIGWVAVGDPAQVWPPQEHERIWALQAPLDFPRTVFGLERAAPEPLMTRLTERYAQALAAHGADRVLDDAGTGTGERG